MLLAPQPTSLEVHNAQTFIFNAPANLQQLIDFHTKYPTDVALAQTDGWRPPEADVGDSYWDGFVHLAKFPRQGPGRVPTGLLELVLWVGERYGYPMIVDDNRVRPDERVPNHYSPVVDRDYQIEAAAAAVKAGRGVLDMPPRAGKTRTMAEVHRQVPEPMLWVAPKKNIVKQTVRALTELFGKHYACELVGAKRAMEHVHMNVVVCTPNTAVSLPDEFLASRGALTIDEFHHAAAKTYHRLVGRCDHIFYRWGMTGTHFRSGNDALAMHAVLSRTVYKVTTTELRRRGYLVPTDVVYLPVDGPRAKGGSSYQTGAGRYGISRHEHRNNLVAWAAQVLHLFGKKVLILVATKEQGRTIEEALREVVGTPAGRVYKRVEFVSTDRPARICQEVIEAFAHSDEVQILIGTSMVGEGTDLPPADALVYAPGRKAEVELAQAAFRVATAFEGKRGAILVDFADRHHPKLLEHAEERLSVFYREPTFKLEVLEDPSFFTEWVQKRSL